ncbi:hypothetical protein E2C01_029665 [Portunus trituberculatus]|uniref:Uncharacterized protein n=1 Tax=Portunus trituberculatus TaxID=210409 RepID=A0A5B7ESU3_PORTR|nr:hypothetical protein [Portunus trituberculatus]
MPKNSHKSNSLQVFRTCSLSKVSLLPSRHYGPSLYYSSVATTRGNKSRPHIRNKPSVATKTDTPISCTAPHGKLRISSNNDK